MTSTTALKVGAAYIRVSTDGQMDLSPESQLESIVQYAKSSRIVIPKEYIFMESEGRSNVLTSLAVLKLATFTPAYRQHTRTASEQSVSQGDKTLLASYPYPAAIAIRLVL